MYLYALVCRHPYESDRPFVMFVAAERLLDQTEARGAAIEAVNRDALGNEWIDVVADGQLSGPVEIEGVLRDPSIAVVVP